MERISFFCNFTAVKHLKISDMKVTKFNKGQVYTKGVNKFRFYGMIGKDYLFELKDESPDALKTWNTIKISHKSTDILNNLK